MRRFFVLIACLLPSAAMAQGGACADLANQRNTLFKAAGYCFKSAAHIRRFGNAGCRYHSRADVPFSARDRGQVAAIDRMERDMGCR